MERLKSSFRKFYGRYGDPIQHNEVSLSRMLNDILTLDQLQWLPNRSDFPPISWPWYRAWLSPNYEWFPLSICNELDLPTGNAYPSRHLVPSPFWGLAYAQIIETSFPEFAVSFLEFSPFKNLPRCFPWFCLLYGSPTVMCCHIYNYNVVERDVKPPINQPNQPACFIPLVSMWSGVRSNTCLLHVTYASDGIGSGVRCYLCLLHVTSISDGMGSDGRSFKGLLHVTSILDWMGSGVRSVNK